MATNYGTCPNGGLWYTCENQNPTFFGCCTSNPCNGNGCPASDLRAAGMGTGAGPDFSANDSSYYPNVQCSKGQWYTCAASKPSIFQGCCGSNPCSASGCPADVLYPAAFKTPPSQISSTSSASTASPTKSSTGASTATAAPQITVTAERDHHVNVGAIAGGAVAGVLALILMAIGFFYWGRRRQQKKQKQKALADPMSSMETPMNPSVATPFLAPGSKSHLHEADGSDSHRQPDFRSDGPKNIPTSSTPSPGPPPYQTPYSTPNPNHYHQEIDSVVVHEMGDSTPHMLDGTPVTTPRMGHVEGADTVSALSPSPPVSENRWRQRKPEGLANLGVGGGQSSTEVSPASTAVTDHDPHRNRGELRESTGTWRVKSP